MSTESDALLPTKKNEGSKYYKVGMWTGTTEQHLLYMWIGQFILGTCLVCAFAAAIIVAAVVYTQNKAQEPIQTFLTSQEFFANKTAYAHPFVDKSSEFAFPIYKIQCTNASGVPILFPLKNHKYAAIAKECDQPSNVCLRSTCSEDYLCVESLKDNATCSSDADCFTNSTFPGIPGYKYRCELSNCSCVAIHALPCTQDSDCPQNQLNTCAAYTCNVTDAANFCVLGLAGASTCSSNEECAAMHDGNVFWYCNTTGGAPCDCFFQPPAVMNGTCTTDEDCPQDPLNTCALYTCNENLTCVNGLAPGANCSSNEECARTFGSIDYFCNIETCLCEFHNITGGGGGGGNSTLPRWVRVWDITSTPLSEGNSYNMPFGFSQQSSSSSSIFTLSSPNITVLKSGWYEIATDLYASPSGGTPARVDGTPYLDGIAQGELTLINAMAAAIVFPASQTAAINITAGQILNWRITCVAGTGNDCTISFANVFLMELDGT